MGDIILKAFIKYVESHPDVIEKLIAGLVDALVKHLEAPK